MAIVFKMRCMTCGVELDGDDYIAHIGSNPTHIVAEVIYDDEGVTDLTQAESLTRVHNGELYAWDGTRELWLSVHRTGVAWGRSSNNVQSEWLRLTGVLSHNHKTGGFIALRNACITKISLSRTSAKGETVIYICEGTDKATEICNITGKDELSLYDDSVKGLVDEGTTMHCLHEGDRSKHPYVWVEMAWRI